MYSEPIAYFITWTCYGTWLPGDDRGWTVWHGGKQPPQPLLADWCREQMVEEPVLLDAQQREIVNQVIRDHCKKRNWHLHAVNCRSNHCHVVVTAPNYDGETVRNQLKGWAKRKLKKRQKDQAIGEITLREHWWTKGGSVRVIYELDPLDSAIEYTLEAQDFGGSSSTRD